MISRAVGVLMNNVPKSILGHTCNSLTSVAFGKRPTPKSPFDFAGKNAQRQWDSTASNVHDAALGSLAAVVAYATTAALVKVGADVTKSAVTAVAKKVKERRQQNQQQQNQQQQQQQNQQQQQQQNQQQQQQQNQQQQ